MITLERLKKIALVFVLAAIISIAFLSIFQDKFDAKEWKVNPDVRYKMANDIIEQKVLYSKTREEVIQLLGLPDALDVSTTDFLAYKLGTPPSFFDAEPQHLVIKLKDNKVVKVVVEQD